MPIDPDFPKNHQVIGKHKHADGEHCQLVWGLGRTDAETSTKPEVQEAYKARDSPITSIAHATEIRF